MLILVAGTHHSPDGLLCRPIQPGDEVTHDDQDFGDWIDRLHSFIHQIIPIMRRVTTATLNPIFTLVPELDSDAQVTCEDIPHSENAK